ncbi:hypothetical protein CYLTODRAFT_422831 [Cylindrobasidium torrendii FP15055 ss-10]|uniref:Uncharacterized protein n=1 Tax=Cylindrobasidium torrendii FP15055 ss-10 TaxID=1314674 RepID=A0A0D7B9D6_9AGAR|nr:hypothetical protein CYLTODRAFT_422831 [Cylindrobasidium torrendii FP15055 ss-10]
MGDHIPCEVLVSIFLACRSSSAFDTDHGAMVISHVCRRWRDIALNDACEIWAILTIEVDLGRSMVLPLLYLDRSKYALLDLTFNANAFMCVGSLHLQWAVDILLSHIHRISELRIYTCHDLVLEQIFRALAGMVAPRLTTFQVVQQDEIYSNAQGLCILEGGSPMLKSVSMILALPILPMRNLTDIELAMINFHPPLSFRQMLNSSKDTLKTLKLSSVSFDPTEMTTDMGDPIVLPELRVFKISLPACGLQQVIPRYVSAPALHTLIVANCGGFALKDLFDGWAKHTMTSVEHLVVLDIRDLEVAHLAGGFNIIPNIRHLEVVHSDPSAWLSALTKGTMKKRGRGGRSEREKRERMALLHVGAETRLPWVKLAEVELRCPAEAHRVLEMLRTRASAGLPLKRLGYVRSVGKVDIGSQLKGLVQNGLQIVHCQEL